jgi:hypothetical protein
MPLRHVTRLPASRRRPPLFGLAPGGVYPAAAVAGSAVRSYRTVSPVPAWVAPRGSPLAPAVCFLWHFPWGRPRRPLAGTVFPWSPDFPPTPPERRRYQRPSGRLAAPACAQPSDRSSPLRPARCSRSGLRGRAFRRASVQPTARATASRRARVPASAWPLTVSPRQWRWKARNTVDSAGSSVPSGATS